MLVCCLFMFFSCSSPAKRNTGTELFSIDSLITAQARYLSGKKVTITKVSSINAKNDQMATTPKDTSAWRKELEIFTTLDLINKPLNRSLYKIERIQDSKSNLNIKAFSTTEKLPVRYLKIYYHQNMDRIRKIEAEYDESNALFSGSRFLSMEFSQRDDKAVLTSYKVIGGQKMFLDDTVQYSIKTLLKITD